MDYKDIINNHTEILAKAIYDEAYKKAEQDIKRKQKEVEENAYKVINGDTYVELNYEINTNRKRFGMDLNNIKQTYYERGALIRDESGKYVPAQDDNTFVMIDGKLYINLDDLCILYFIYSKQRMITKQFYDTIKLSLEIDHDKFLNIMYDLSNIENKQRNPIYKEIRENKK